MGVILRQGSWNTVLSYIGVAIGVLNLIFLYPFFFQAEEIGLIRILTSLSLLFAHVASLGNGSIFIRFFPHFRTADKKHQGFVGAIWTYAAIGFVLATVLYLLFRPWILTTYSDTAPLFLEYDLILIPLALFVVIYNLAEIMDRSIFQTVFTLFAREVLLRLLTTIGIASVAWLGWTFEGFIIYFLAIHVATAILVLIRTILRGEFKWVLPAGFFDLRKRMVMMRYGAVTFLSGITTFIVQSIDSLMLGAYVNLEAVGIYTIAFFMGSVIAMPARAISRIATPIVADSWKRKDIDRIERVYRSSSYLNFSAGAAVLVLIIMNLHSLFEILPPIYATGFMVVVLIGAGHLIDMTGGLNANILATSPKYHLDLYVNISFIAVCILLNILLIPAYGLNGAAMASALSYALVNASRCLILYRHYGFNPFGWRFATVAILISIVGYFAWLLPLDDWTPYIAIPSRSIVFVLSLAVIGYAIGLHKQIQSDIRI